MSETDTVTIQIGNSDDKLSQSEWHSFCGAVNSFMQGISERVHFAGCSEGSKPWQNACWVATGDFSKDGNGIHLVVGMASFARDFRQDSIAVTFGKTVLVEAYK